EHVPEFRIAQVFTKAPPGAITVPSGIVTSEIKVEARVQVVGTVVAGGTEVPAGRVAVGVSGDAVGMTAVSITSVAVPSATLCVTFTVILASPVPKRALVAFTVI